MVTEGGRRRRRESVGERGVEESKTFNSEEDLAHNKQTPAETKIEQIFYFQQHRAWMDR